MTTEAQIAYKALARIATICRDLQEAAPEDVQNYARRLHFVLVLLNFMARTCFVGYSDITKIKVKAPDTLKCDRCDWMCGAAEENLTDGDACPWCVANNNNGLLRSVEEK